jgi:processive 1,2-diacylglycerol beta-glucosyltransferase
MGGSLGFGCMQQVFSSLLALRREIQIIAVTGRNKKLQNQLESLAQNSTKNVRILGYTDRIDELMDISSLLITKPGGITVSEALVKKLPILIMTPIPGQEERNAQFLVNSGAALRLNSCNDMDFMLRRILDKPSTLRQMSDAAKKLAKPHACGDTAGIVEELIQKDTALYCINQNYKNRNLSGSNI